MHPCNVSDRCAAPGKHNARCLGPAQDRKWRDTRLLGVTEP